MFDSAHTNGRASSAIRIATTALTIALLVATTTMASAQGGNAGATNKKALVGSWLETVTFPPESGRPPLKSLGSFHADETMVCSDQGAVTTEPPSVFSSCHGVWTHLKQRTFAYTSRELISDLSGNLVGYLKVRGVYTVSRVRERVHRYLLRGDRRYRRQRALLHQRDQRGRADQARTALSAARTSVRRRHLSPSTTNRSPSRRM